MTKDSSLPWELNVSCGSHDHLVRTSKLLEVVAARARAMKASIEMVEEGLDNSKGEVLAKIRAVMRWVRERVREVSVR